MRNETHDYIDEWTKDGRITIEVDDKQLLGDTQEGHNTLFRWVQMFPDDPPKEGQPAEAKVWVEKCRKHAVFLADNVRDPKHRQLAVEHVERAMLWGCDLYLNVMGSTNKTQPYVAKFQRDTIQVALVDAYHHALLGIQVPAKDRR